MNDLIFLLYYLFIVISPFFNGIYFEKDFTFSFCYLTFIFILQMINCIVKKQKIYYGKKRYLYLSVVVLGTSLLTYFLNEKIFNIYVDYSLIVYGTIQILELIMFYLVTIQIINIYNSMLFENTKYIKNVKNNENVEIKKISNSKKSKLETNKKNIFNIKTYIPYCIILSGLLMTLLMFMPEFYRKNRFEGTFKYANSFAIYLFICFTLVTKIKINKYLKSIILTMFIIAIVLTNSRITYVILCTFCLCIFISKAINKIKSKRKLESNNDESIIKNKVKVDKISRRNKLAKIIMYLILILIIILVSIFYVLNNENILERFNKNIIARDADLKISYYKEATSIIKEYPFGLGYEGYLNFQSVKDNKYKLRLVHNFLFQWTLNYGFGMLALGITFLAFYFFECKKERRVFTLNNLIILLVLVHSLQDINLSFLAIDHLLILLALLNIYVEKIENNLCNKS